MSRRLLSTVATGALLLGLAACGDPNPGAVTTPPPDLGIDAPSDGGGESSDGGGEPTAEAPDIPPPDPADYEGKDENTPEGAEQAFRYYIAVSMWAHQTGDIQLLETLSSDECSGCSELNGDIPELAQHNMYWTELEISDVGTTRHDSSKHDHEIGYFFSLSSHQRPAEDFSRMEDPFEVDYLSVGGMDWHSDRWLVDAVEAEWGPELHDEP